MPKPIIRDIQIRKKVPEQSAPVIKPIQQPKFEPRPEPIIRQAPVQQPIIPIENDFIYKERKPRNNRLRNLILIFLLILLLLCGLLYIITGTKITITPRVLDRNVSESITLNSWTTPISSTVMSISETSVLDTDEENTKKILEEKIKNRYKYDTPRGYMIVLNCKTDTYFENQNLAEGKIGQIKATSSALIIEKNSLLEYLRTSMKLEKEEIKNIDNLSCELKSDVTKYTPGQKAENLSFLINGDIKTEKILDTEEIKNQIVGKSKKKALFTLNSNESIMNYRLRLLPFNFFPIIPKNIDHIKITIESLL